MKINNVTKEIIAHTARIGNRKSSPAGLSYRQCTKPSHDAVHRLVSSEFTLEYKAAII